MPDILVLILPVWAPPRECGPLGVSLAIPVTTLALFVGFCFGSIAPVWIPSVDNLGFPVGALWVELPANKQGQIIILSGVLTGSGCQTPPEEIYN